MKKWKAQIDWKLLDSRWVYLESFLLKIILTQADGRKIYKKSVGKSKCLLSTWRIRKGILGKFNLSWITSLFKGLEETFIKLH